MWLFPKKQLKTVEKAIEEAFKFPEPLKYATLKCQDQINKYTIEVIFKDKTKSKFEISDSSYDYTQYLSLKPKEFRYLEENYKKRLSDDILKKAKELYEIEFKIKQINRVDPVPYQYFTNADTFSIPLNGDHSNSRIVRSEAIKEVRITKTVKETLEYDYLSVCHD